MGKRIELDAVYGPDKVEKVRAKKAKPSPSKPKATSDKRKAYLAAKAKERRDATKLGMTIFEFRKRPC